MKHLSQILLEARQRGDLYHFTSYHGAVGILKANTIHFGAGDSVSFTRNSRFHRIPNLTIGGSTVRFTLDGGMISNRYKIQPFNHFNRHHFNHKNEVFEYEERIHHHLKDVNRYIKAIHIDYHRYPENEYDKWKIGKALTNTEGYYTQTDTRVPRPDLNTYVQELRNLAPNVKIHQL